MSRATARRGLSALLTLACALAAVLVALGGPTPAPQRGPAFSLAGAGALTLQNDRAGTAILQATGLRPGGVAEGTVTVWATGGGDVALALRHEPGTEEPGTGGGRLSDRLALAIDDVTGPGGPVPVYSGPLAELDELPLVALAGGGAPRRYRFRATFPSGPDDNAFQGAALAATFVWTGVAAEPTATPTPAPTEGPVPAPPATPPPGTTPPAAPAVARVVGLPAAGRCVKRRRYAVAAKPLPGVKVQIRHCLRRPQARQAVPQGPQGTTGPQGRQARHGERARRRRHERGHRDGHCRVPPLRPPGERPALNRQREGSFTTVTKNSSICRTTSMKRSKSTGLVT